MMEAFCFWTLPHPKLWIVQISPKEETNLTSWGENKLILRKCNTLYKELRTNESHIVAGGGHLQNISNKMSRATFTSVLVKHTLILLFCKSLTWKAHSSQPKSNWPTLQLLEIPINALCVGVISLRVGCCQYFPFCYNSLWCGIWGQNDIANIFNLCAITFHIKSEFAQTMN